MFITVEHWEPNCK